MRKFLRKRWHGIPLGILLTLLVVAGAAAGAYTFWSGTVEVTVEEAIVIQWWDGAAWVSLPSTITLQLYPGESVMIPLRGANKGPVDLVATLHLAESALPAGGSGQVTFFGGFADGRTLTSGSSGVRHDVTVKAEKNAPTGVYTFTANFTRG